MYSRRNSLNILSRMTNLPKYFVCVYYNISMTLPGFQNNSYHEKKETWYDNGTFSSVVI